MVLTIKTTNEERNKRRLKMKLDLIRIDLEGVNSYLLKSEEGYLLVDTGGHLAAEKVFSDRKEKLVKELERAGVKPDNLKLIVITHGHSDHIANVAYLKEQFHTKTGIHEADAYLTQKLDMPKMKDSFKFESLLYRIIFKLIDKKINMEFQKTIEDYKEFEPDIYLKEGDSLLQYGFDVRIIHIPGHSLGSIGLLFNNDELICGDTLANIKKPTPSPNAYNFKTLHESIARLGKMKLSKIYPGHGKPFDAEVFFRK
jgi:glyoxylase-like metal-dependent hydrolase (beta-lactamase superfamily II)